MLGTFLIQAKKHIYCIVKRLKKVDIIALQFFADVSIIETRLVSLLDIESIFLFQLGGAKSIEKKTIK